MCIRKFRENQTALVKAHPNRDTHGPQRMGMGPGENCEPAYSAQLQRIDLESATRSAEAAGKSLAHAEANSPRQESHRVSRSILPWISGSFPLAFHSQAQQDKPLAARDKQKSASS